jgi:hypothetical protein
VIEKTSSNSLTVLLRKTKSEIILIEHTNENNKIARALILHYKDKAK